MERLCWSLILKLQDVPANRMTRLRNTYSFRKATNIQMPFHFSKFRGTIKTSQAFMCDKIVPLAKYHHIPQDPIQYKLSLMII